MFHAFLGAMLAATSVGITARVLKDLGALRADFARIILGAAVIDDVLGPARAGRRLGCDPGEGDRRGPVRPARS